MITLTQLQLDKIVLLDKLFNSADINQLREISESEQVVAKLRGEDLQPALFTELLREHNNTLADISGLRTELRMLKNDLSDLIWAVNHMSTSIPPPNDRLQCLKSKYNVY
jgi:hypothetical protein